MLTHGGWFSPGTPASSTIKTGHHDIAEILLKVALNTIKSINQLTVWHLLFFILLLTPLEIIIFTIKTETFTGEFLSSKCLKTPYFNLGYFYNFPSCPILISGVMISMFASSVVVRWIQPRSSKAKDYEIRIYIFSA